MFGFLRRKQTPNSPGNAYYKHLFHLSNVKFHSSLFKQLIAIINISILIILISSLAKDIETNILLAVLLGLFVFNIAIYLLFIKKFPEHISKILLAYLLVLGCLGVILAEFVIRTSWITMSPGIAFLFGTLLVHYTNMFIMSRLSASSMAFCYITINTLVGWRIMKGSDYLNLGIEFIIITIILFLFLTKLLYRQEFIDFEYFKKITQDHQRLENFKKLLEEVLPNQVLIYRYDEATQEKLLIFFNKACKTLFESEEAADISKIVDKISILNSKNSEIGFESNRENSKSIDLLVKSQVNSNEFQVFQGEYQKDGKNHKDTIHFQIKIGKISWYHQETAILVLLNDISKEKKIDDLKAMDKQKNQILATVSHDLRTPLNGILGMIEYSLNAINDKKITKKLKIAEQSAHHLMYMINDILDFSQITNQTLNLNFECVNLKNIAGILIKLMKPLAKRKGIALEIKNEVEDSCNLFVDPNRLKQILLNLIGNAIKFTKQGTVKLKITADTYYSYNNSCLTEAQAYDDETPETYRGSVQCVVFEVEDTGVGIKEEDLPKLFQLYGKLKQNDTEINKNGVGLGLAISQKLATLLVPEHFGGIKVASEINKGSRFWLPIKTWEAGISILKFQEHFEEKFYYEQENKIKVFLHNNHSPLKMVDALKIKVLAVDDDVINLIVISEYLKSFKIFEVDTAKDGDEALEKVDSQNNKGHHYSIIFLDNYMPRLSGLEVAKQLRAKIRNKEMPKMLLIATSGAGPEEEENLLENGFDDVIRKPIIKVEFFNKVESYLKEIFSSKTEMKESSIKYKKI